MKSLADHVQALSDLWVVRDRVLIPATLLDVDLERGYCTVRLEGGERVQVSIASAFTDKWDAIDRLSEDIRDAKVALDNLLLEARQVRRPVKDEAPAPFVSTDTSEQSSEEDPTVKDHSDDICTCGDPECNRLLGHEEETT